MAGEAYVASEGFQLSSLKNFVNRIFVFEFFLPTTLLLQHSPGNGVTFLVALLRSRRVNALTTSRTSAVLEMVDKNEKDIHVVGCCFLFKHKICS